MLEWKPQLGVALCSLLILCAMAWVPFVYRRILSRTSRGRAVVLMIPKILVLVLLVMALFEPVRRREHSERATGRLIAMIDTSASMSVKDDGTTPRVERARNLVQRLRSKLPAGIEVQTLNFDTRVYEDDDTATPSEDTDLGACLLALSGREDVASSLGILLLTDGGDETLDDPVVPDVPVSIIAVGTDPSTWNDLAIAAIRAPATVESGIRFNITADIGACAGDDSDFARQLSAAVVVLEEKRDESWAKISEKPVSLLNRMARVSFPVKGEEARHMEYRVSVRPVEGELSLIDNARTVSVDVRQKSLRVLYYTEQLGMDFKMLRNELARDPGISFTALFRTHGESYTVQGELLPGHEDLRNGFPADKKYLEAYDTIIIGSFPAADWSDKQVTALTGYVDGGGAVVFMGGEQSFGSGGYANTSLSSLFPWQVTGTEQSIARGVFSVNIPRATRDHPVIAGVNEVIEGAAPVLESLNLAGALKPGAISLLNAEIRGQTVSAIAIQSFGRGRVIGIASNTLWKWMRKSESLKLGYGRFWRQAVRNIAESAEGGGVLSVSWDKERYRPGERASASVRTVEESGGALKLSSTVAWTDRSESVPVNPVPDGRHEYSLELRFPERDNYSFHLTAYRGEKVVGSYDRVFRVASLVEEGRNLEVDKAFLEKLASTTDGKFCLEKDADNMITDLATGLRHETVTTQKAVVEDGPYFIITFILFLLTEWVLRRRRNMI